MFTLTSIHAREVLDSRGNPTVEAEITLDDGSFGTAIVPSGASTGSHEALELRDGDAARYLGKGVLKAVDNINNEIKTTFTGMEFAHFSDLDKALIALDGTPNKSRLGANAILAVSMAFVCACAKSEKKEVYEFLSEGSISLPIPLMNIINGGAHADNPLDIQECMIVPVGGVTMAERVRMGAEVFHHLKKILSKRGLATSVGDEGGFAPAVNSTDDALGTIVEAIKSAGYDTEQIKIALDVASTEFFKDGMYHLAGENKVLSAAEMVTYYEELMAKYPIISIEDGMSEDDIEGWKLLTEKLGNKILLVGDDLFVTNKDRLQDGINGHYGNSILIKLNQIGTVTETLETIRLAHANGMKSIISHRSGETEDTFIADLVVGMNTGYIKTGSLSRTDRIAKYNRLMRIEEKLGA
ncbi:MAG: phosphopyruvate hydratase [bacterium]